MRNVMIDLSTEAYISVMLISPSDTDRYRSSWRVAVGDADTSVEPVRKHIPGSPYNTTAGIPPSGGQISAVQSTLGSRMFGEPIIISNNLDYAVLLEEGRSTLAPGPTPGIVAQTVQHLEAQLSSIVSSS